MKKRKNVKFTSIFFIPLIAVLSCLTCFSTGFALWIGLGNGLDLISGTFEAEAAVDIGNVPEDLDVVSITSLSNFEFAGGYGFVNDGTYLNNVVLSGECHFNYINAGKCLSSFRENKTFKLEFILTTDLINGFSGNNFSSASIALVSEGFADCDQDPSDGSTISSTFVVACYDDVETDFDFNFSINLVWGGADLSNFPDLTNASFNIIISPKENAL